VLAAPVVFAGLTVLAVFAGTVPPPEARAAAASASRLAGSIRDPFDPMRLRETVRTLADTAWTGRGPGTTGIDEAAQYLAMRFEDAGLEPLGDGGTWFQGFDVNVGVELEGENRITTRRGGPWEPGRDFLPLGFSATGTVMAPLVFAGYGITAPQYDYDDYAGVDATGRIVVVLRYEPGEEDSTSRFDGRMPTIYSTSAPRPSTPASTAPRASWS
jgi:hypothetical protein